MNEVRFTHFCQIKFQWYIWKGRNKTHSTIWCTREVRWVQWWCKTQTPEYQSQRTFPQTKAGCRRLL